MFIDKGFTQKSVVSIVGAGGKTSLMFFLARRCPWPCLITTTTKIGADQIPDADLCLSYQEFLTGFGEFSNKKVILVTPTLTPEKGKISGFSLELFSEFARIAKIRKLPIINEADGAHMRHIKAPASFEPVVPAETNYLLHMTGLDVLGKQINAENVHRLDEFLEITGTREGDFLDETAIEKAILHPQGGFKNAPAGCKRIAVLNQADTPKLEAHANSISLFLLENGIECVWITRMYPEREMFIRAVKWKETQLCNEWL